MSSLIHEAHLLFAATLTLSSYLVFRALDAGLLGSLSLRYLAHVGKLEEMRKLEVSAAAERSSVFLRSPGVQSERREAFEAVLSSVPVDEATGEAVLQGPPYKKWVEEMKRALRDRCVEAIGNYRRSDGYYRDTFCKMTQGLATQRAWKDAQEHHVACDRDLQDIMEWAERLQKGWKDVLVRECSKVADSEFREQMGAEQMQMRAMIQKGQENEEKRKKERAARRKPQEREMSVAEKERVDKVAKQAEMELLNEEEETASTSNKNTKSKKGGKKGKN